MTTSNFVSFSGGKDSTAMLLMMLERGIPVKDIVFFDTGWEFPEMYTHLDEVEQYIGRKITRLLPRTPFTEMLLHQPVVRRSGEHRHFGNGWPSPTRRWCTREKTATLRNYSRGMGRRADVGEVVYYIGFSVGEEARAQTVAAVSHARERRHPLIEWGVDAAAALAYCRHAGFTWGGLYDIFNRVGCFCCPLQRMANLRLLRTHRPNEWQWMLDQETRMDPALGARFNHEASVHQLERRFAAEEMLS